MTALFGSCLQKGCPMAQDGRCLDGIVPVSTCSHYVVPAVVSPATLAVPLVASAAYAEAEKMVDLPRGTDLDVTATRAITSEAPSQIIILAGARDSGKTTFLVEVYERFLNAPFAGFMFAGSETLLGFERRCHLSRMASERKKRDTERTKVEDGQVFVHLRVRSSDLGGSAKDLLFSDISGEHYLRAAQSSEECRKLDMIPSAHHFVLFLDGKKLLDKHERHIVVTVGRQLLRRLVNEGLLGPRSLVDVVFSKLDLLRAAPDQQQVLDQLEGIKQNFRDALARHLGRLAFFEIAARVEVPDSTVPDGHGLAELLTRWVQECPDSTLPRTRPTSSMDRLGETNRAMDHYLRWRLGSPAEGRQ